MHISMHSSCIYLEKKPFPNRSINFRYLLPIEECSCWTSCAVNSWQSRKRIPGKPTRTGDHFTIENFNFYNAPLALWQNSWSVWVFDPASTGLPVPSDGLRPQLRCWHEKRGTKVESFCRFCRSQLGLLELAAGMLWNKDEQRQSKLQRIIVPWTPVYPWLLVHFRHAKIDQKHSANFIILHPTDLILEAFSHFSSKMARARRDMKMGITEFGMRMNEWYFKKGLSWLCETHELD